MCGLENMVWGSCQTDSVFPKGVSPFLVRAHFCLSWAGENLPLKTAFLAFGPSLEKLTQSPPGVCSAASRQEQNLGERKPQRIALSSWLRQGLTIFGWLPTLKNWKH